MLTFVCSSCSRFCHILITSASQTTGRLPDDEVAEVDPELQHLWLEARERRLGHLSAYSFDLTGAPPGTASEDAQSLHATYMDQEVVGKKTDKPLPKISLMIHMII